MQYALVIGRMTPLRLSIAGKALAGFPFSDPLLPAKSCIRIMTGASIPAGVDTVIMQENTLGADILGNKPN